MAKMDGNMDGKMDGNMDDKMDGKMDDGLHGAKKSHFYAHIRLIFQIYRYKYTG